MEDEFDFDIPGLDPKELKRAKRIAMKDIKNEFQEKVQDTRSSTRRTLKDNKDSGELDKE